MVGKVVLKSVLEGCIPEYTGEEDSLNRYQFAAPTREENTLYSPAQSLDSPAHWIET